MTAVDEISVPYPGRAAPAEVAVIGTGAIGRDLVGKIDRSQVLTCGLVAGRDPDSEGLAYAARLGCPTSAGGIDAVLAQADRFAVVFDATNAMSHLAHWRLLEPSGVLLVDLTPSRVGRFVVPSVTGTDAASARNVSLVSCGGQASVPVVHALAARFRLEYVEVVSTVASDIAGRATRLNLDEYVATTQHALTEFSGVRDVKAILNISPAVPSATFRTAVHAIVPGATTEAVRPVIEEAAARVREFAPGYRVSACTVTGDRLVVCVEVAAVSDVLPPYAGNLDLIGSAAVLVAEQHAVRCAAAGQEAHA
ncbi:acetaldehyde dehydrogenase (acetylating) [Streptomyces sp. NPDC051561]|uniref:acetaldehyde dehydrogenase (acetylating) n=1 Tax=Streptomyces sp. NPDC051561 TaxID=3365658 RepID=UPI0037B97680